MIKTEKHVTLTIDGKEIQVLRDICELARRRIADKGIRIGPGAVTIDEYAQGATREIQNIITDIFDLT